MKVLLLDIDYTIMNGETPRPHLKEFIEKVKEKYQIVFYTAAQPIRVTEVCRIFYHKFGMDRDFIRELQMDALHRQNCPMIEYRKPTGTSIEIKCFKKASEKLDVPIEDLIMLDDNPSYDHPNASQIIQAEGFWNTEEGKDDYLIRVLDQLL